MMARAGAWCARVFAAFAFGALIPLVPSLLLVATCYVVAGLVSMVSGGGARALSHFVTAAVLYCSALALAFVGSWLGACVRMRSGSKSPASGGTNGRR